MQSPFDDLTRRKSEAPPQAPPATPPATPAAPADAEPPSVADIFAVNASINTAPPRAARTSNKAASTG
ncbi:MAG: hypothetical protein M3347_11485, partial [Armatimonadota bacterium]|nr:hypothetical protein [Armatimonadota bacterium]